MTDEDSTKDNTIKFFNQLSDTFYQDKPSKDENKNFSGKSWNAHFSSIIKDLIVINNFLLNIIFRKKKIKIL